MPGQQQFGRFALALLQGLNTGPGRAPASVARKQGGVEPPALELAILVMLDQMVVRVARKGQRIQPQRIDHRQCQQPQSGCGRGEMRAIEVDEIVAEHEAATRGQCIEAAQRRRQIAALEAESLPGVATAASWRILAVLTPTSRSIDRQLGLPNAVIAGLSALLLIFAVILAGLSGGVLPAIKESGSHSRLRAEIHDLRSNPRHVGTGRKR